VDLVYVYKRFVGGCELKYSLRSACANLTFDKVVIVGDEPVGLKDIVHIHHRGPFGKHVNCFSKLQRAIDSPTVSDPFVLMNDDFFILRPFEQIPYLYMSKLSDWVKGFPHRSSYYEKALKTLEIVGDKARIFETHFPIVYEKEKLRRVIEKYKLPCGIMLRTLYAHEYKIAGEQSPDFKARSSGQLIEYSKKRFMSTTEQAARTNTFRKVMNSLFPEPSRFEIA
jgi:hypothetical protein